MAVFSRLLPRSRTLDGTGGLSWRQFETLLTVLFRKEGYRVEETANGADGGIDHILRGHGETVYVQAKHWNARRVGLAVVQRTYAIAVAGRASRAMVVTSGTFTPDAVAFAGDDTAGLVELVDGVQLLARLQAHALADAEIWLASPFATGARRLST